MQLAANAVTSQAAKSGRWAGTAVESKRKAFCALGVGIAEFPINEEAAREAAEPPNRRAVQNLCRRLIARYP